MEIKQRKIRSVILTIDARETSDRYRKITRILKNTFYQRFLFETRTIAKKD